LFEIGKAYLPKNKDLPDERDTVCGVMGGFLFAKSWQDSDKVLDFFDAKGLVESLLERKRLNPKFKKGEDAGLHPHKQADIFLEDEKVGVVGEVHPSVLSAFDINEPVYLLEMDLKNLVRFDAVHRSYFPIPKYPSIVRDMALIVDVSLAHEEVKKIIQGFPLVEQAEIFDVYSGEQVPPGKKSLAYRIGYRSPNHTLTDTEVNGVEEQVLERLKAELGAALRS
jgi:phenylalanyl-tRNA synthetase beta chain